MKVTSGVLGSHLGMGLLKISALVALVLGVTLALLLAPGSVKADGPYDFLVPIVLEEGRVSVKVVEHPGVEGLQPRVLRQVQGQVQGTQTSTTLVSNTGQTPLFTNVFDHDYAQAFTTGSHSEGYKLTSVKMFMSLGTGSNQPSYTVAIHETTSGTGTPATTALGTLSGGTSLTSTLTLQTFTASGTGISLDRNTVYWLVMNVTGGSNNDAIVSIVNTDAEDGDSAAGWAIADDRRVRAWTQTAGWAGIGNRPAEFRFAVEGYEKVSRPVLESAEVNGTSLVLSYDKGLDTTSRTAARQFGIRFGGGALQRATAISISGRQVTLTVPEVRSGQVVTVSYTVPTSNPLKGSTGVAAAAFSDQPVTVNTGPAFGRLPESGKVRSAIYLRYTNENGEDEVVEHRLASADRETLLDYFEDECGRTGEGAKWGGNNQNCAFHKLYVRQSYCANEDWRDRNPQVHLDQLCPTDRTW